MSGAWLSRSHGAFGSSSSLTTPSPDATATTYSTVLTLQLGGLGVGSPGGSVGGGVGGSSSVVSPASSSVASTVVASSGASTPASVRGAGRQDRTSLAEFVFRLAAPPSAAVALSGNWNGSVHPAGVVVSLGLLSSPRASTPWSPFVASPVPSVFVIIRRRPGRFPCPCTVTDVSSAPAVSSTRRSCRRSEALGNPAWLYRETSKQRPACRLAAARAPRRHLHPRRSAPPCGVDLSGRAPGRFRASTAASIVSASLCSSPCRGRVCPPPRVDRTAPRLPAFWTSLSVAEGGRALPPLLPSSLPSSLFKRRPHPAKVAPVAGVLRLAGSWHCCRRWWAPVFVG